ncbi:MAG: biopolymer transporter ExbD [Chitinispirillia bacterium]|nr:biopolymer transporter ExbD [Chitinispirillia bacterium]MCL2267961.1 biopolymer transporter ExbD [Chitinispirillia bacterium]
MANKLKAPDVEPTDVDLKVFMNLMVVLIPMLIVSAEFASVAIIDIKLPEQRGSQTKSAVTEQPQEEKAEKLLLTAIITDSVVTLGAKGGFMPSLFYQEFHRYITREKDLDTLLEYTPGKMPNHPRTGRELTVHERFEIYLYTVEPETRNIIRSLYTKFGEMLTDADGIPVREVKAGDTVFALTNPRRRMIVTNPGDFESKPLSAYDELKNRLMKIKERYREAEDGEDIIIAAENEVIYDKIVQIMDAARNAEFPNISIAKLRG